jgi:diadenosine tetraphosphatase ApaH/serine/threonine PP2A family protein phosphatase
MRILVVADVHANLAAFETVIAAAEKGGAIDNIWSLGDIVGYGPQPCECIALLRSYDHVAVIGNHDSAAIGAIGLQDFNPIAASAASWTRTTLSGDDVRWLRDLPQTAIEGEFTLTHGSLRDPIWDYLLSTSLAETHLQRQTTPYGLVGHSHIPIAFFETETGASGVALSDGTTFDLTGESFVANPGGLGQPRDGDPRACYAIVDTDAKRIEFRRIEYDIEKTQEKMRELHLPPYLVDRLARGR